MRRRAHSSGLLRSSAWHSDFEAPQVTEVPACVRARRTETCTEQASGAEPQQGAVGLSGPASGGATAAHRDLRSCGFRTSTSVHNDHLKTSDPSLRSVHSSIRSCSRDCGLCSAGKAGCSLVNRTDEGRIEKTNFRKPESATLRAIRSSLQRTSERISECRSCCTVALTSSAA